MTTRMNKSSAPSHLRVWLNNLPIENPVDRQMARLLQVILIGLMGIISLATILNLILSPVTTPRVAIILRGLLAIFIMVLLLLF